MWEYNLKKIWALLFKKRLQKSVICLKQFLFNYRFLKTGQNTQYKRCCVKSKK